MTDLLTDPADTLSVTVTAPNDSNLYGAFAGKQASFVLLACYPTVANNPRADYPLPTGSVVPHMQTGADPPLFADATARYPMLVFSHGLNSSPLSNDDIAAMSVFASYGYIVVAPFHGDPRFANLKVDDLIDAVTVLAHLSDFNALQALRPLSMSAAIDLMLTNPQWRDHVDRNADRRIRGEHGRRGNDVDGGCQIDDDLRTVIDPGNRRSAFQGGSGLCALFWAAVPAGVRARSAGTRRRHAVVSRHQRDGGYDRSDHHDAARHGPALRDARTRFELVGVKHEFDVASTNDIFTWSLTFLDAEVRGNQAARQQLSTMASVAGGGDDRVVIPYNGLTSF